MDLLPGLPNDVALECLIRIPFDDFSSAALVCKNWKYQIEQPEFHRRRKAAGLPRPVIVLSQARVDPERRLARKLLVPPVFRLTLCEPDTGHRSELQPPPELSDGLPLFCHLVRVGSELVLMGGYDPATWEGVDSVFIYNFAAGEWRRGADMPGRRRLFFGCASDSERTVYVAGGHDGEKNALKSAMMYNVANDEWAPLPDMAKARDECRAMFHRGKLHVIGGYPTMLQGQFTRDAEVLDVSTGKWGPVQEDFLESATCAGTCVDGGDGKLYLCSKGKLMVRDEATWQVVTGLPPDMFNIAYMTAWQGQLLLIGLSKFGGPCRQYVMDLRRLRWTKLESPEEFSGHIQAGCWLEL